MTTLVPLHVYASSSLARVGTSAMIPARVPSLLQYTSVPEQSATQSFALSLSQMPQSSLTESPFGTPAQSAHVLPSFVGSESHTPHASSVA